VARDPTRSPSSVCPRCGAQVPDGWPNPGFDHCLECGIPLGGRALTNEILQVNERTRPISIGGASLVLSGVGVLGWVAWTALSLPNFGPTQAMPAWGPIALLAVVAFWIIGAILSEVAIWMGRRELRRRGIDSRVTRVAALAFFPRYVINRLMRSGRLGTVEPVVPHPPARKNSTISVAPSWSPRFIGYDRE
jgi:hypothetical protein